MLFLVFIWFVWFMTFTARSIFSPVLPLIEDEFVVSHAKAASIFTVTGIGYVCSLFLAGTFASLFGPRKSIQVATIVSGLTLLLFPLVRTFNAYYVLGFILGVSLGVYMPSVIPLITDYYEEALWGRAIAIHGSAPSVSIFVTPFIALAVLAFFSWRAVFVLCGLVFLVCALIFRLATDDVTLAKQKSYFLASLYKRRAIWAMGTVWIFAAGANIGLYFVIPLFLVKELSLDMDYANTVFGLSRLGGAVLTIVAGLFVDRFSLKRASFTLVLATGILTMVLGLSNVRWIPVLLFLQAGISPTVFAFGYVAVAKMFSQEERGQATGFVMTISMIGTGLIPYFLGLSGDYWSFRVGILVLGILTALSSFLFYTLKELK